MFNHPALTEVFEDRAREVGLGRLVEDASHGLRGKARKKARYKARQKWLKGDAASEIAADIEARRESLISAWNESRVAAEKGRETEKRRIAAERRKAERESPAGRRRADLLRAARTARAMGCDVRASKGRDGRVSSYYIEAGLRLSRELGIDWMSGPRLRISDHDVPETWERSMRAEMSGRGSFNGSADIYASADGRRPEWWRRAIRLGLAGRNIPGAVS